MSSLCGRQIDSRSADAAACKRALTSTSSRAARSIRSRWVSACSCWLSARSRTAFSWSAIPSTVRVRSASWRAISAVSASGVIYPWRILWATRNGTSAHTRATLGLKLNAAKPIDLGEAYHADTVRMSQRVCGCTIRSFPPGQRFTLVVAPGNTITLRVAANRRRAVSSVAHVRVQYAGSLRPCPARFSPANHARTSRRDH